MAAFVYDSMISVVDNIIVCDTKENRWISKSEDKSDPMDADRLARLLRMGECKPVYFPLPKDRNLQELMRLERKSTTDIVRAKNRIKDVYRRNGVRVQGKEVYEKKARKEFLGQIKNKVTLFKLKIYYQKLDAASDAGNMIEERLHKTLKSYRPYRLLKTIPGIGEKLSILFIATIIDPFRFSTKQKLWKYGGLSIKNPWSANPTKGKKGGSNSGNRILKYAAMQAARLTRRGDNYFSRKYNELIKRGLPPANAQRTIARKILAAIWAIWKSGTAYCEPAI